MSRAWTHQSTCPDLASGKGFSRPGGRSLPRFEAMTINNHERALCTLMLLEGLQEVPTFSRACKAPRASLSRHSACASGALFLVGPSCMLSIQVGVRILVRLTCWCQNDGAINVQLHRILLSKYFRTATRPSNCNSCLKGVPTTMTLLVSRCRYFIRARRDQNAPTRYEFWPSLCIGPCKQDVRFLCLCGHCGPCSCTF